VIKQTKNAVAYIFSDKRIIDEELGAEILFCDNFMVCECDGAYAGKDEVLGDFVGKRLDRDEKNVGVSHPAHVNRRSVSADSCCSLLLSLDAP
jgi:hypothetical protein